MPSFPVLVTGASRRYFEISQGVIKSVHEKLLPKYQDLTFIYYDLGLAKDQREKVNDLNRVQTGALEVSKPWGITSKTWVAFV